MRRFMFDAAHGCFAAFLLIVGLLQGWLYAEEMPPVATQPPVPQEAGEKPATPEQLARKAKFVERNKLWDEALRLKGVDQIAEAIAVAEKMFAMERELLGPVEADFGYSASWIAEQYEKLGNFKSAAAYRREQLTAYRAVHGDEHWQTRTARLFLADNEQLWQLSPNKLERLARADKLTSDAIRLRRESKLPDSLAAADEAVTIRREILGTAHRLYASALIEQARGFAAAQQYQRAAECYAGVIACEREILGDHPDVARTQNLLAILEFDRGNYPRSEQLHQQAAELRGRLLGKQSLEYAGSLNGLGLVYSSQGNFPKAEPLFKEAIAIRQARQDTASASYATVLNNLGCLYVHMRDYPRAEPIMREVLALRRKVLGVEHEEYASSLGNLAHLLGLLGKDDQVAPLYEEALTITRQALGEQHSDVGVALNNLGVLHFRRKDYSKSADYLQQALAIYERTLGPLHPEYARTASNLGRAYVYQGNQAKAARYLKLALSARTETLGKNHHDRAISLAQLSELQRDLGQYEQALALQREAVEVALFNLDLAAAAQSERQQLALVNRHRSRLDELVSLAIHMPKLGPETYDLVLAFKGRVLAGQRLMRVVATRPDLLPVMDELRTSASRLATLSFAAPPPDKAAAWKQQIAELSEQKETLERRLSAASNDFRTAKKAPTLAALQAALPPDAALVDLLVVWHQTIDWFGFGPPLEELQVVAYVVRDRGPPKFVELGPYRPIEAAIDTWRESFGQSEEGRKSGELLREKLWQPLVPHLEKAEYVLLSPEENLGRLAFASLPGKEPGTYLLEERKLAMIPAPQTLLELAGEQQAKEPEKNLLVVAGVDYDQRLAPVGERPKRQFAARRALRDDQAEPFQPLAGTQGELATIQKLYQDTFGPDGLTTLQATGALQDNVVREAPKHLYLHLATHGYFAAPRFKSALDRATRASDFGDDQLQSDQTLSGYHPGLLAGLALAGANYPTEDDDGILTAEEVGSLNLAGVQLVVLSACETGLGKNAGGEGLLGLQRAFQAAGARTVIGSLWKVPDTATRDLMERFYDNLWTKEMGKLEALREAQLWMLRERGARGLDRLDVMNPTKKLPPFYWGAFTLSGDWR